MPKVSHIEEFIKACTTKKCIDVRSPKEFAQGHIPNAINMPLFNNEERAVVGTIYKQQGKQPAILKGLEIVGPKLAEFVTIAKSIAIDNTIYIHCWRGGMRSGSVAWLLEMYGFNVFTLKGGYKAFRKFALNSFEIPKSIIVLGGKTGSGKTLVLKELQNLNQQVLDLEQIAKHKGSSFGSLGEALQPTQEQFENELAMQLFTLNADLPLWVEDESRLIGNKVIPEGLWQQMNAACVIYVLLPFNQRVNHLVKEYGTFSKHSLQDSIKRITKRLGPEQTKLCLEALELNDLKTTCELCLQYYDKSYSHGLKRREKSKIKEINFETLDPKYIANQLIKQLNGNY